AHQIPIVVSEENPESIDMLENWLKSYKPEELFDKNGTLIKELQELSPKKNKRMSANPVANGGLLLKELIIPDFKDYAVKFDKPGTIMVQDTKELGNFVRDVVAKNPNNFKVFGPDETKSNRLTSIFEVTDRQFNGEIYKNDEYIGRNGSVLDSMLSEHLCQGWLEGYLLTGRHGFFNSYEAFIRIVDSMASQHAKWLKVTSELSWRKEIASLNYLLSSHVWQQDHNGYTHQDPGFLNHIATKKADVSRMYLPPDANCLLSCFDHCIRSKNYINVIVASKHPSYQWLNMEEAVKHCTKGIGVWDFASNDQGSEPDIVMACCGDVPTLETLAAVKILRNFYKDLKIRVVNVVDLMKLESNDKHPHGLTDFEYNNLFTKDKHIIFNFHGYPNLIHQLTYNRKNKRLHVHGYNEEGTITTPFDMRVQNKIDRFNLVKDALKYLDKLGDSRTSVVEYCNNKIIEHNNYIKEYGIDMPEILNWCWNDEETDN
ncbi:MAG: phosphoketolase family protein, partial [Bacilli bacterium]|nr:phosphoketolase family protein [Bacilli bacterium]